VAPAIVASPRPLRGVCRPRSALGAAARSRVAAFPAAPGALPEAQTWMWTRGMRSRMQPGRPAAGRRQPQLRRIAVSRPRRASRFARGRRSGPRSEAL
jgi:hypothetical protein